MKRGKIICLVDHYGNKQIHYLCQTTEDSTVCDDDSFWLKQRPLNDVDKAEKYIKKKCFRNDLRKYNMPNSHHWEMYSLFWVWSELRSQKLGKVMLLRTCYCKLYFMHNSKLQGIYLYQDSVWRNLFLPVISWNKNSVKRDIAQCRYQCKWTSFGDLLCPFL